MGFVIARIQVAQKIKCPMCLRGGEELARRTLTNKDEVALIDEFVT